MIDRAPIPQSLMRIAPMLVVLLACTAARANGDHPMRLPPPDPGPALAKIAAEMKAAALAPAPVAALQETAVASAAREPGEAIFSPFSTSSSTAAADPVARAEPVAATDNPGTPGLSFTLLAALGGLVVGAYLWRRAGDAH